MPNLSSLPNEILYTIISHVRLAPDLASLLLCSRHFATLCAPFLSRMQKAILAAEDVIYFAVRRGHAPLLQLFHAKSPKYRHKPTVLHTAARCGQLEMISLLLSYGVDVDGQDEKGFTALHDAIFVGHIDVVTALLKAGAYANLGTYLGMTPLYYAAKHHLVDITKMLINHGGWFNYDPVWTEQEKKDPEMQMVIDIIEEEKARRRTWQEISRLLCSPEELVRWPPEETVEWPPEGKMDRGDMIIPWWFELHDEQGMGWELRSGIKVPGWLRVRRMWLEQERPPEVASWPTDKETDIYGSLWPVYNS